MNTNEFFGFTKRKFLVFIILAILLNLIFGPFGFLKVETSMPMISGHKALLPSPFRIIRQSFQSLNC